MARDPLGLSRASHPGRQDLHGARQGGGRASSTRPELHARRHHRTSFRKLTQDVTSCRTTGLDMTRFPTAAHLVSWAGLAPVARQSGPRSRKPRKGQGDSYLRCHCTQAATGAATTDTFLGERLRRLSRRLGGTRARCAVGRSILVIIWHLLADPEARYTELGPDWHARKTDTDRRTRSLLNQLRALHPDSDITIAPAA